MTAGPASAGQPRPLVPERLVPLQTALAGGPPVLAELHCHVQLGAWQPFRPWRLRRLLARARKLGLRFLAITEHADIPSFWSIYQALEELNWRWREVTILPGVEISLAEGADILVIGPVPEVRRLFERLVSWPARGKFPAFDAVLAATADLETFCIGAHPFRPGRMLADLPSAWLARLDALEINRTEVRLAPRVEILAAEVGLPVVGGSDAHWQRHLGRVVNILPSDITDWAGLRQAVRQGQVKVSF